MMRVLALDLATRAGFAACDAEGVIRSGAFVLKAGEEPAQVAIRKLASWLWLELSTVPCDLVVIEQAAPIGAMIDWGDKESGRGARFRSNPATINFLVSLVAAAEAVAGLKQVKTVQVPVLKVRKFFLGEARPKDPKRATILRCRALGLMGEFDRDDNQADALALLCWARAEFDGNTAIWPKGGFEIGTGAATAATVGPGKAEKHRGPKTAKDLRKIGHNRAVV